VNLTEKEVKIINNFLPSGTVPKGLCPTFYHTLSYETDVALQNTIDAIRDKLQGERSD
jgi:hypothetical protein